MTGRGVACRVGAQGRRGGSDGWGGGGVGMRSERDGSMGAVEYRREGCPARTRGVGDGGGWVVWGRGGGWGVGANLRGGEEGVGGAFGRFCLEVEVFGWDGVGVVVGRSGLGR